MEITYLGHASFLLKTKDGSMVFDPHINIGYDLPFVSAEVVSVSHGHYDHNNTVAVAGARQVITDGDFEGYGFKVTSIKSYHDDKQGVLRGENFIRKVTCGGVTFAHLGDFGEDPNGFDFSDIIEVDFLFVPVGGKYTVNADGAKKIFDIVRPRFVIPMHYKTEKSTVDIASVDGFLRYFPTSKIIFTESTISVDALLSAELPSGRALLFDMPDGQSF